MIREIKENYSYNQAITFLSIFTFIFGTAVCFVGEIFLPFAAAFLAALYLFEKPNKISFAFVCPLVSIVFSSILIGPVALIGLEYVFLAFIIFICYQKSLSKAETAIYLTSVIVVFMVLSFYVRAGIVINDFSPDAVLGYYKDGYRWLRRDTVTFLSEMTATTQDGVTKNLMSVEDAELILNTATNSFISVIVLSAFTLAGVTEKIYSTIVLRYSKHGILKTFAHFIPSNFCAYTYIASLVLTIFISDSTVFGIAITNVNNILLAVFLYMGLKYLIIVAKASPKKLMIYAIIIAAFLSFTQATARIISYLGIWVVIGTNAHNKEASK